MTRFSFNGLGLAAVAFILLTGGTVAQAQTIDIDAGYLDTFELTDGRTIDVGALGGGLEGQPTVHKTIVTAQTPGGPPWPPNNPSDGRLTGTINGKLRVVGLTDRNGDSFINGADLDIAFDVSWQLIGFDKNLGPSSAFYVQDVAVGPEGTVRPYGPPASVNFPPTPGGTASIWNISTCDVTGFNPNTGSSFCNPFAIPVPPNTSYTGFVNYTFPVSIPGVNDFTPGLQISNINWIIAALVGNTLEATPPGSISYGSTPTYNPILAVNESNFDLFGPNTLLNFPGEQANVPKAGLLTTVQINVIPEPAAVALLALGALVLLRRSRS